MRNISYVWSEPCSLAMVLLQSAVRLQWSSGGIWNFELRLLDAFALMGRVVGDSRVSGRCLQVMSAAAHIIKA